MAEISIFDAALPLVLLLAGACYLLWLRSSKTRRNAGDQLPPGSMGFPLVGQTLQYVRKSSALKLEPFISSGRNRYGKIFQAHLFGAPIIVSTDTDTTKLVMQNEGKLFQLYWPKPFRVLLGEHSLLFSTGDEHKRIRSIMLNFMGTGKGKLTELVRHVESAAIETIGSWGDTASFKFHGEANDFTLRVLCKVLLSLDQSEIKQMQQHFRVIEAGLFCVPIKFPGSSYAKALQARAKLVEIFDKMIMERRQKPRQGQKDLLDMFLAQEQGFSNIVLQDLLITIFGAGHETTALTLTAIVKLLKDSPEAVEELLKEHSEIRKSKQKDEPLTPEDYAKMAFSQCVLNEVLRLVNLASGLFRVAKQDVKLKDYLIPEGSIVFVSIASIHHEPDVFPDSSTFDPFRWQKDSSKLAAHFMPFGGGVRHCPGSELARMEAAIFLHHFVTKYSWELGEPDEIVHSPVLSIPKGLPIVVKARKNHLQD